MTSLTTRLANALRAMVYHVPPSAAAYAEAFEALREYDNQAIAVAYTHGDPAEANLLRMIGVSPPAATADVAGPQPGFDEPDDDTGDDPDLSRWCDDGGSCRPRVPAGVLLAREAREKAGLQAGINQLAAGINDLTDAMVDRLNEQAKRPYTPPTVLQTLKDFFSFPRL